MTKKVFRSAAAKSLAEQRKQGKSKPVRDSKKFTNGSGPHLGASRSQSGQPKRK